MESMAEDETDEDEDEETLQLKIKAYEAKLKLKKLQRAKSKTESADEVAGEKVGGSAAPRAIRDNVQVLLSPVRRKQPSPLPTSPARVILGLENRAQDVSLKRPRYKLNELTSSPKSSREPNPAGSNLRDSPAFTNIKSFGDRVAESRAKEKETLDKKHRMESARSKGFGFASVTSQASNLTGSTLLSSTQPVASVASVSTGNRQSNTTTVTSTLTSDATTSFLEPYSGFHLTSRHVEATTLARAFKDKELYSIPRLFSEVKAPDYEPPDCVDFVLFGIVASKSGTLEQRLAKQTAGSSDPDAEKPKFMAFTIIDLQWELSLFLFGSAVDAFYRVPTGTAIAILNPTIMKPRGNINSGKFSLSLGSSDETLLELGHARDLGYCTAKKANGQECLQWIDGRKTEVCEYHISLKVDKARKGRMQLSTMTNRGGSGNPKYNSRVQKGKTGLLPQGKQFDRGLLETYYIAPGANLTRFLDDQDADVNAWQRGMSKEEMVKKREKAQAKEKELAKKLVSLGNGGGQGSEYLKAHVGNSSIPTSSENKKLIAQSTSGMNDNDPFAPRDAGVLGLLSKSAASVSLLATRHSNVAKRKHGGISSLSSEPMGWGGASKRGLMLPTSPKKKAIEVSGPDTAQREKKRARFMLESKGIREPGRESLTNSTTTVPGSGIASGKPGDDYDDDDDDLEIV
jgi:minichromosome maintenance protein 10